MAATRLTRPQVHQVVHGEHLLRAAAVIAQHGQHFVHGRARLAHPGRLQHQQTLAQRRAPGIEGLDADVGVFLPHPL